MSVRNWAARVIPEWVLLNENNTRKIPVPRSRTIDSVSGLYPLSKVRYCRIGI